MSRNRAEFIHKCVSLLSAVSLLVQSVSPVLVYPFAVTTVQAQEAQEQTPTPTSEPTATETPSDVPESTITPTESVAPEEPIESPTVTPTVTVEEPTQTPSPEVTESPLVTPTEAVVISPTDGPVHETSPPETTSTPVSTPTPESTAAIAPTPTVTSIDESESPSHEGTLTTVILTDEQVQSLNSTITHIISAPSIRTDLPDYAPTDMVVVFGDGFVPVYQYSLRISSEDEPAVSETFAVTTDATGSFVFEYQLDGIYRPNYAVHLNDGDVEVAAITFTDANIPSIVWPSEWTIPVCSADIANDENPDTIDLVGSPAVGYSGDANYAYFRERVKGDPGSASHLDQKAWVVLFQTSGPQYQYLGSLNGKKDKVQLWENTSPAGPVDFDPLLNDPAETLLWEGSSSTYSRVTSAGGGEYYLDWAIPVTELTPRGITLGTTKFFATSADANNFNKDFLNCYTEEEKSADLSITKTDDVDPVVSGGVVTYTITVTNNGPDTAENVIVTDELPAEYALTSITSSVGSCSDTVGPVVSCELGYMEDGSVETVTLVGTMTGSGTVMNGARVTSDTPDPKRDNNEVCEYTTIIHRKETSISGYKYRADGETGIEGWRIILLRCEPEQDPRFVDENSGDCSLAGTTLTDEIGYYEFTDLEPGYYKVVEVMQPGWTNLTPIFHIVYLSKGEESTHNDFKNFKNIDITVCKVEDSDGNLETRDDLTRVPGWEVHLIIDGDLQNPLVAYTHERTGCYTWEHLPPGHRYATTEVVQDGWVALRPVVHKFDRPEDGVNQHFVFANFHTVSVGGQKYQDTNGNAEKDEDEFGLSGWTIQLMDTEDSVIASTVTDEDGNYLFTELEPGVYRVREVQQEGWTQTTENPSDFQVASGQDIEHLDFGNRRIGEAKLVLTKSNNAEGDKSPGENVLFTLTVAAPSGDVDSVVVKDLPAGGFAYRSGSWTAVSSVHGVLSIPEPTYHSPGTWQLGNMEDGEVITLTYLADISGDIQSGAYRDLAWTQGIDPNDGEVIGNDDTGVFVGTDVQVVRGDLASSSINVIREQTGSVLGASTELPATGAHVEWIILAGLSLVFGTTLMSVGFHMKPTLTQKKKRRHHA